MNSAPRFIADEMLGKLARDLRALGYDVGYVKHVEDDEILDTALEEDRLLLTRDRQLADRAGDLGVLVEPRDPETQLAQLLDQLELTPDRSRFLSRCMACNTELAPTDATDEVPDSVADRQHWRCPSCGKVYWLGTHAIDMLDRLGEHLPPDREASDARAG